MKKKFFIFIIIFISNIFCQNRFSSEPFLSGDTLRNFCDFIVDETNIPFYPEQVKNGDTIFVSTEPYENVKRFFEEYHPKIKAKYILITHNGDRSMPGEFIKYLEDKKIFVWFTQNMDSFHNKLIPIPIGIENKHWQRNYPEIIDELISKKINLEPKKYLLYGNFNVDTNEKIRRPIAIYFKQKDFCFFETSRKSVYEYLTDVSHSKYVLSPHGNGLDCHRTWEALHLKVFPIVKTSPLDKLYEDLPVLIIDNWKEVTKEFLEQKYEEMKNKEYKYEKLYFNYWKNLILECQIKCRKIKNEI